MGINSLILIMPWEGSAQIIILPVPREGASHSLLACARACVHPDSTWPLGALQGGARTSRTHSRRWMSWSQGSGKGRRDGGEQVQQQRMRDAQRGREVGWAGCSGV